MWPPQRRIGQLLGGKYRVQQLLALGGMGVIYSACHELTGRSVAIKLLRPELATRPDLMRRVAAEARLAVEASHPNVVEVLDAGADDQGIPYVVLERLYGQPLEALLGERLSPLGAAQALLPVMNALVTLHGAGIVHRDIKPPNIFLSCEADRVVPKLLDFGIAKALASADSTESSVALGTPSYMAPEQALGCFALGPPTDVWSLAVVLVRCLSGRLPFAALPEKGPSVSSFALQAAQLEHVPEPIGLVLSRALQLDPRDRFASVVEFRRALLEALRQVDGAQRWPSEATVAYSLEECALASALRSSRTDALQVSGAGNGDRRARPADVATRTLSKAWQTVHGWPRRRVALAAMLGLASVLALHVLSRESDAVLSAESAQRSVLAATPENHATAADREGSADTVHAITSAVSAPESVQSFAAPRPVDVHAKGAAVAPQKLPRERLPSPDEKPVPAEPTQSGVPLGPNRSPIIE
jgi:eukaryotic-like serine/threonine-protein kinase